MTTSQTELIKEGTTEVFVFQQKTSTKGPGAKDLEPFYNPSMELNRDLSILVNQWLLNNNRDKHVHLLDGLAASGIRGVRLAHELEGDFDVTINDRNDQAFSLLQQNIKHSQPRNVVAFQKDLNALLSERKYHSIDIDPFGSPIYYIDAAMRSIYNTGVIAVTATDKAALCGVFPSVCHRRYGVWPLHAPCMHEIGLRILCGVLCREAAKYDRGIEPLVSYATDHYLRIYVQVKNGKNNANKSMEQHATIKTQDVPLSPRTKRTDVGPLWLGTLNNKSVVQELRTLLFTKKLGTKNTLWKLLDLLEEEADGPPFFYTMNDVSSLLKKSSPNRETLIDTLRQKGYMAARTHLDPMGFKTNAPFDAITEVFK